MKNNINESVKKYSDQLTKLGIEHKILEHPASKSIDEVITSLGKTRSDSAATLVMKAGDEFVSIIRRDDCRLDTKKVKKLLGVDSLRIATDEEFTKITGLEAGAMTYFNGGILKVFIDKKILENEYIVGGSGSFDCSISHKTSDLTKIPNSQIVDVAETSVITTSDLSSLGESRRRRRVLSGIRATGRLHLGNYLGAVKGMLELQDRSDLETLYMVADLHALTTPYDKNELKIRTREVVLDYLSAGLDPEKSTLFIQSHVPEHTELFYLLSTVVSLARMQHLPTYKDKIKQFPNASTVALLNYPVLMAADILIYNASLVPVGIDQEPHLEIAREIARKMNETYGTKFPEPVRFATSGEYVPSLAGEGKMSKSVEGSFINLTDDLKTIQKRLAGAPTDSGKGEVVPTAGGVSNLLKFVELFEGIDARKKYEQAYRGQGIAYRELKENLAHAIYKELLPIQEKRKELEHKTSYVDEVIKSGAEKARKIANETILEVKEKMGLI